MASAHHYSARIKWTGNNGSGTESYNSYQRSHIVTNPGKPEIGMSSDPVFRGDKNRYNPEELLVASLASCHMLWYLHLCADAGVVVIEYSDNASGTMSENEDGSGQFSEVILRPTVRVAGSTMVTKATELHHRAHEMCFIARSCNFPVKFQPKCYS